jgi:hypothetical protein
MFSLSFISNGVVVLGRCYMNLGSTLGGITIRLEYIGVFAKK